MICQGQDVDSSAVRFLTEVALGALKVKEKEKEEAMRWRKKEDVKEPARMEDVNRRMAAGLPGPRTGGGERVSTTPVASSAARPAPGRAMEEKEKRREKKKSRRSSSIRLPPPGLAFSLWSRGPHHPVYIFKNIGPGFLALVSKAAFNEWAFGEWALEGAWALNTDDLWQQCVNRTKIPGTMCVLW